MHQDYLHKTIKAFNDSAQNYENVIGSLSNYNHCYDEMIFMMKDNEHVLDLACGPGNVSKYIKKKINVKITGYDLAEGMLELAKLNVPDGKFEKRSIAEFNEEQKYDWIINAFGLPFLDKEQRIKSIQCSAQALKNNGHLFISFMDGTTEGFEKPSFSGGQEIYFIYHNKHEVLNELKAHQFALVKEWELDFDIGNGDKLKDVILIVQKKHP
jgi:2-polyprenyl-3-methyl-5-hydroxy-6-metoxy-1,4-benzoquinol methylase